MLRHEFRPGKLIAGTFFTIAGVIYAGDAGGLWETPWFAVIPIVVVGLFLAAAAALLARSIRRHRNPAGLPPADKWTGPQGTQAGSSTPAGGKGGPADNGSRGD